MDIVIFKLKGTHAELSAPPELLISRLRGEFVLPSTDGRENRNRNKTREEGKKKLFPEQFRIVIDEWGRLEWSLLEFFQPGVLLFIFIYKGGSRVSLSAS